MGIINRILITSLSLLIYINVNGQTKGADISRYFKEYEIVTFDTKTLLSTSKRFPNDFFNYNFKLSDKYDWNLKLSHNQVFADNFILREGDNPGKTIKELSNLPVVLSGLEIQNNEVQATITVNNDFLYGFIETRSTKIYFEPLSSFDENAQENEFIVYDVNDVISFEGQFCAASEHKEKSESIQFKSTNSANSRNGSCLAVEYAIANDHWVYDSRGGNTASWNAGVVANMNTDYDDSFNDEIRFEIVEIYVSQNTSQDSWGNNTDLLQVLNNFTNWAPNGFNNSHDLGGIWSKYNYSGSTIGWASIGAVCGPYRYHALKDYGGSASGYQNLCSHEVGHNFNCSHDSGSGFIMSGSVSGTTTWSAASKTTVNNYYPNLNCLGTCDGGPPSGSAPVANFGANLLQECNPTQVQMLDQSTNSPTAWSWQFQNGSPGTSTAQNPIVNFPGGGNYRVTLTASNSAGADSKVLIMTLNVTPAPVAGFTHNVSGNTANFTNTSTGATSYLWNFGDGSTSTSANPSHAYNEGGSYSVTLTSTNSCGSDSEIKTVIIADQIIAAFSASTTSACAGQSIEFYNQSIGNITSFAWEFEGGSPSTSSLASPVVQFNNSGTFNVKLTVQNGNTSDIENKINYITIINEPTSAFTYSKNGYNVIFDNNSIGGNTYTWDFGDGNTSSTSNPNHTYSPGTYLVKLTSTNNCGSNQSSETIVIEESVVASFESSAREGCEGLIVNYASTSTGDITSFFWQFEGGSPATSTSANPSVTYNSSGSFNAKLTVSNASSSDIENKINHVFITGVPQAEFTYTSIDYLFSFDNNTTSGNTYLWDFGDGITSTTANPDHLYNIPGSYNVVLTAENECGSDQFSQQIFIEEIIEASYEVGQTSICEGESINFYNTSFGELSLIQWEFEGGSPSFSTAQNPIVKYNNSGLFNVKLTVQGTYGAIDVIESFNKVEVSKYSLSDFSYALNEFTVSFNNLSQSFTNISWDFGDGQSSNSLNPVHTYANEGDYTVKLTASNSCGVSIKEIVIPVYDQLLANFQASKTVLCPGETVELQDLSSGNPDHWMWHIEGSSMLTIEEQNPTFNLTEAGTYNVELIVSNLEEENSKTINQYIKVMNLTEAKFAYVQNELNVAFENNSTDGSDYFWDFGDGETSNAMSPLHNYAEEGVYTVKLTVGSPCNNETIEKVISVYKKLVAGFYSSSTQICSDNNIKFYDLSSGSATSWNWNFPGGNPNTSTEKNPTVHYDVPGNYDVSLSVNSATEQVEEVKSFFIEVLEAPEVEIFAEENNYLVNFSTNEIGSNEFYWEFGDGISSNIKNPQHNYENEGIYQILLVVSNVCGLDSVYSEVKVQAPIEANFIPSVNEICPESFIKFTSQTSKNVKTWEWSFPGGTPSTSTEKNPQIKYLTPGNYNVQLKVKSLFEEETINYNENIIVREIPKADFEFQINKDSVRFYNISKDGISYKWIFEGVGESNDLSPTFVFNEEKSYKVTLIATNNCSSDTITKTIDLYNDAKTYANFKIEQPLYCLGETLKFLDLSSEDITQWNWSFPGAIPSESTEKNPSVMYSKFGKYNVKLTVSNGFNTRTINLENYVTIVEKPTASFETSILGNKVELTNKSENVNKFLWKLGDGSTANTKNVIHEYTKNGNFIIGLKVENSCGISELTKEVNIDVYPQAGFSLDVTEGCSPLIVNFENRSSDNATEIKWVLKGLQEPNFVEQNPSIEFSNPGLYGIMIIASNEYGSDTVNLNNLIEVFESPEVSYSYEKDGKNFEFFSNVTKFDSLIWDFGDNTKSNEIDPMHQFLENGEFDVKLTAYLGECSTEYFETVSNLSTSVSDLGIDAGINIFPNPAFNYLNIDFEQKGNVHSVEILDQLGRKILSQEVNSTTDNIKLNFSNSIPSGQYFLLIMRDKDIPSIHKFIIAK